MFRNACHLDTVRRPESNKYFVSWNTARFENEQRKAVSDTRATGDSARSHVASLRISYYDGGWAFLRFWGVKRQEELAYGSHWYKGLMAGLLTRPWCCCVPETLVIMTWGGRSLTDADTFSSEHTWVICSPACCTALVMWSRLVEYKSDVCVGTQVSLWCSPRWECGRRRWCLSPWREEIWRCHKSLCHSI